MVGVLFLREEVGVGWVGELEVEVDGRVGCGGSYRLWPSKGLRLELDADILSPHSGYSLIH